MIMGYTGLNSPLLDYIMDGAGTMYKGSTMCISSSYSSTYKM
jgi:hypothetical protein